MKKSPDGTSKCTQITTLVDDEANWRTVTQPPRHSALWSCVIQDVGRDFAKLSGDPTIFQEFVEVDQLADHRRRHIRDAFEAENDLLVFRSRTLCNRHQLLANRLDYRLGHEFVDSETDNEDIIVFIDPEVR